ncbi:MAG: MBOAT family protein [Gammaproteobacteria bacterium]|nr:MAG: MBOAT family protein [Gammaproteobacteria bacterium]
MTVTSMTTLLWLASGIALFWATPTKWRAISLATFTALLLGWHSPKSLLALSVLSGFTWYLAHGTNKPSGTRLLSGAATILVCLLAYRIYSQDSQSDGSKALLMGFAFYTLRLMHYLFEAYKGTVTHGEWKTFISWIFFFPALSVGPIHRYPEFRRDALRQRWDPQLFSEGLERILYGYVKIVVIADGLFPAYFTPVLNDVQHTSTTAHAWLLCLEYGALLYFKFSGYSDVAIGVSRLLGFRIMENFHYPFMAQNIGDFWKRWHISLSSWCRDYAYMPVWSRLRNGALAALASMLVLGLWHELSWRYLAWGLYHGAGIMVWQRWHTATKARREALPNVMQILWRLAGWFITMAFVIAGFALTRETHLQDGLSLMKALLGG